MVFAIGVELANVPAVQRSHDADPREHRRAAEISNQDQRLDRGLPFRELRFLLRQARHVGCRVTQRNERSRVGEQYRVLEFALPACVSHALSCSKYQRRRRARRLPLPNAISRAIGQYSTERDDHQDTHLLISQTRPHTTATLGGEQVPPRESPP